MDSAPEHTDVHELVRATGQTRQAIQARAKREGWPHVAALAAAGRVKHFYPIAVLPERLRFLVGYFRRNPFNLRQEAEAEYSRLVGLRRKISETDLAIARLTGMRRVIVAELEAAGMSL